MRTGLLVGVLLFTAFGIYHAPAGLLRLVLPDNSAVTLTDLHGTLWKGRGRLIADGLSLGALNWALQPISAVKGVLGYAVELTDGELEVAGALEIGLFTTQIQLSGTLGSGEINRRLAPYDIALGGHFQVEDLRLTLSGGRPVAADGEIHWDGGSVRYILSGRASSSMLPALIAYLGPGPEAVVFPAEGQTPLLTAALLENGFAKVGVTKYLTRLLGSPWPGGDADHAVVLEVEEQLF